MEKEAAKRDEGKKLPVVKKEEEQVNADKNPEAEPEKNAGEENLPLITQFLIRSIHA